MYLKKQKPYPEGKGITLLGKLVLAVTLMIAYSSVQAIPITFTYDPTNSSASIVNAGGLCLGCNVAVDVNQTPTLFSLSNIGESASFDFLTVTADAGFGVVGGGSADIFATLAFSTPGNGGISSGSGTVTGIFGSFFGATGTVVWNNQPQNLLFSDGTEVSLNFAAGSDSCGVFGGGSCRGGLSATLAATTTLQAVGVPEPNQLALLGAGMVAFGTFARRKKKSA